MSDSVKLNPKDFEIKGAYQPKKPVVPAKTRFREVYDKAKSIVGTMTGGTEVKKAGQDMRDATYKLKYGE